MTGKLTENETIQAENMILRADAAWLNCVAIEALAELSYLRNFYGPDGLPEWDNVPEETKIAYRERAEDQMAKMITDEPEAEGA